MTRLSILSKKYNKDGFISPIQILSEKKITNIALKKTPIFISHGSEDEVLPIKIFESSCTYFKKNKLIFESHNLDGDAHTISLKAIKLLQKFIKKNV